MGVLLEHSQDVKCVAWHPHEEVNIVDKGIASVIANPYRGLRFWPLDLTTILSNFTWTTLRMTGIASPLSKATNPLSGPFRGVHVVDILRLHRTIKQFEFGHMSTPHPMFCKLSPPPCSQALKAMADGSK